MIKMERGGEDDDMYFKESVISKRKETQLTILKHAEN
jgi:hypothetical protein